MAIIAQLDDRSLIREFDPSNFLSHILDTTVQLEEGARLGESTTIPALYAQAKQLVLLAVGEMLPVALAVQSMMVTHCRIPIVVVADYTLPHWVGSDTLVVALDYSGDTEAILLAFHEAATRRARLLSFSIGGYLATEARRRRAPHIELAYNAPPRAAFTYFLTALVVIFKKLDFLEFQMGEVEETITLTRTLLESIGPEMAEYRNIAKQLAEKIAIRKTMIVGSGPSECIAKKWQLDLASNGKVVTQASTLGEFNDTIINGISYQPNPLNAPLVILLQSKYDQSRNKYQQTLTYQVAQSQRFLYEQIFIHPSGSLFGEIILSSVLGTMVSYYVAWLGKQDPTKIPASQFIREQLLEQRSQA